MNSNEPINSEDDQNKTLAALIIKQITSSTAQLSSQISRTNEQLWNFQWWILIAYQVDYLMPQRNKQLINLDFNVQECEVKP